MLFYSDASPGPTEHLWHSSSFGNIVIPKWAYDEAVERRGTRLEHAIVGVLENTDTYHIGVLGDQNRYFVTKGCALDPKQNARQTRVYE